MTIKDWKFKQLGEVPFFIGTKPQLLDTLPSNALISVFTPNPEQMVLAWNNPKFYKLLEENDLNIPDGQGIVWALGEPKLQRIAGRELFHDLLQKAQKENLRVFLVGGKKGSAAAIAAKYQIPNSKFQIFFDPGAKDIQNETDEERERVLQAIERERPEFIFVAYGAPWQEFWIEQNHTRLEAAGVKLAMVVGGAFEYESGRVPKVSPTIERLHLEWLQRLITEPWRWRRQLTGLTFFVQIAVHKLQKNLQN
ncbi:MAG TPA: WecB/TagA/CpsF family glycosyltransferase [Patescibacteria group bacterium]|nr:WecB/TagA/CpsF family glycosyltransferase [Patescibacteria group bacterium]